MGKQSLDSLWGDDFSIKVEDEKEKVKKVVSRASSPKTLDIPVEKKIKSKTVSLSDKLKLITDEVYRVLGKQRDNVLVIRKKEDLDNYIRKAIAKGAIAVDTETNNSLDPVTCKIMGLCLYVDDEKQAYVPIHHRDPETKMELPDQLNEQDIRESLSKIIKGGWTPEYKDQTYEQFCKEHGVIYEADETDGKHIDFIYHNGKFDYQVLKCTCGFDIPITWDTLIGAKLLDENEKSAKLKVQYITKIDPEQEKYDIEGLFKDVEYADVDPNVFALYAATDSMETKKLCDYQIERFKNPDLHKLYTLATQIEMPLVTVIAEMELQGMEVDQNYAELLSTKFHKRLDDIDSKINLELATLNPKIEAWRLTKEANEHPAKKKGDGVGKSKNEQLENPINLSSPTQLAILFYDVLKCPQVNKKAPRGTGEEELKAISEKLNLDICNLLLDRRECVKLLTTYIDAIPELAKRWPDGRVRTHFNAYGAATGRLSSSDPINF